MIINANFSGGMSELFVTLTYKENMQDTEKLHNDYKKFTQRLRYKYKNIEMLAVVEPQERGAWHLHCLIKDKKGKQLYIPFEEMDKIWGHGATTTKRLVDCDNVGAYLTAYLTNLKTDYIEGMENCKKINVIELEGKSKAFIKNGRLSKYPAGMNIYRITSGIIKPQTEKMTYKEAKKKVQGTSPNFRQKKVITGKNEEGKDVTFQTIQYEQYNLNRKE